MSSIFDIRYRHLLFRSRRKYVRLKTVPISLPESILISDDKTFLYYPLSSNPSPLFYQASILPLRHCANLWSVGFLDIGYRIKVYSDIPHNVGFCSFQSDIGGSDITLSPISLITDIGLNAHQCWQQLPYLRFGDHIALNPALLY